MSSVVKKSLSVLPDNSVVLVSQDVVSSSNKALTLLHFAKNSSRTNFLPVKSCFSRRFFEVTYLSEKKKIEGKKSSKMGKNNGHAVS